jgi:O-methyltransferase involved in polyketide biosynthesis
MTGTNTIQLGSVQKTLLLPLWGRALETGKKRPLLVDRMAVEILSAIDYDFSTMARNISPLTRLAWIARSLHTDRTIREFLERDAGATVVNLGCGLDTTFERVDNGHLRWVDLDLPDVMELRRKLIPESPRRRSIACSLLDDAWLGELGGAGPVLFVAGGVLYYLEESQLKTFFIQLADAFPGCEILFDACTPRGLRAANERVLKAGGMDESAVLKWGLRRAGDMEAWDSRIRVLADYPTYRGMKRGIGLREKVGTTIFDVLRIMSMVHLRLGTRA